MKVGHQCECVYACTFHPQRISVCVTWKSRAHPGNRPSVRLSSITINHHRTPTWKGRGVKTGKKKKEAEQECLFGFTQRRGGSNLFSKYAVFLKLIYRLNSGFFPTLVQVTEKIFFSGVVQRDAVRTNQMQVQRTPNKKGFWVWVDGQPSHFNIWKNNLGVHFEIVCGAFSRVKFCKSGSTGGGWGCSWDV